MFMFGIKSGYLGGGYSAVPGKGNSFLFALLET